jgi:hypothetical protein
MERVASLARAIAHIVAAPNKTPNPAKRIDSGEIMGTLYDAEERVSVHGFKNVSSFKWFEVWVR